MNKLLAIVYKDKGDNDESKKFFEASDKMDQNIKQGIH